MTSPLWQKVKRNWRASWWKWKKESEKSGLKLHIQKTKIMASGRITSWQIDEETVETVTDVFLEGDSKITADGDCSHEIKRRLLLGRKVMSNLDSILKSRDIAVPTKVYLVKAMVFPESWTIKKAESQRIDAFELWCWRRFLRVPWTTRRSNQSILKEISPEYSLEGLRLKLQLQYFGHLVVKNWVTAKEPDAGQDWRRKEKETTEDQMVGWHHRLMTWVWVDSGSWWWTRNPGVLQSMGSQSRNGWATELSTKTGGWGLSI